MSYLRRAVDSANNEIQFEVSENASSINLKFDNAFSQSDVDLMKIRVEKVTKNQADQTLYTGTYADIKDVLKFAFPQMGNILPFALGKSLELSDDNKIVVTIGLTAIEANKIPTSFEFEINKNVETTASPLILKKVSVDEELSLSTELYQVLAISADVESYETVVLKNDTYGVAQPTKVYFGKELIKSIKQKDFSFHPFVTAPNQEVTLKGTSVNYLISL